MMSDITAIIIEYAIEVACATESSYNNFQMKYNYTIYTASVIKRPPQIGSENVILVEKTTTIAMNMP